MTGYGKVAAATDKDFALCRQLIHFGLHVFGLVATDQWAHAYAFGGGVTQHRFSQARFQRCGNGLHFVCRHDDAANGGTFLAGLGGHLLGHLLDEEVEFFIVLGD